MVTLQDCWLPEGCSEEAQSLESTLTMKIQTQRSIKRPNPSQSQLLKSQTIIYLPSYNNFELWLNEQTQLIELI